MKKIIGIAAVAAMVATSAFAGVNVGGWGRSGVTLLEADSSTDTDGKTTTSDPTVIKTPSWSDSRVGVNFSAADADGNIGFNLNVDSNAGSIGIGNQAKIWAKLFNKALDVEFGRIQLDDLRGSIGGWGDRETYGVGEEDSLFPRFNPQNGMTVAIRPIEGLFIGAAMDVSKVTTTTYSTTDYAAALAAYNAAQTAYNANPTAANLKTVNDAYAALLKAQAGTTATTNPTVASTFGNMDFGIGYTIKDTMQIKAAYFGNYVASDAADSAKYYGDLWFGVDILSVKNNTIELSVQLPLADKAAAKDYFGINAGIGGGKDAISYKAHLHFYGKSGTNADGDRALAPEMVFDGIGEYALSAFSLGLGVKEDMVIPANSKGTTTSETSAEFYAKKGFSNGYIFAGVGDTLKVFSTDGKNASTNKFYIPVGAEYWF